MSRFLLLLGIAGAASLGAWIVVVYFIDPTQTGAIGIGLFYATLACWLFAAITLAGLLMRVLMRRLQRQSIIAFRLMLPTLRQALWSTLIAVISLILAAHELFSWFTALMLILFFTLLEGFLYSLQKDNGKEPPHEPLTTPQ